MSKTYARHGAAALAALFLIGCATDQPANNDITGADASSALMSATQLADPNGVIVTVNGMGAAGELPTELALELQEQGAQVLRVDPYSKLAVVAGVKDEVALEQLSAVNAVMPNPMFTLHTDQSSAHFYSVDARQQNLPHIRANNAWATPHSGAGVNVCIIDSGIDDSHPDMAGTVSKAISYIPGLAPNTDGRGHGTHVASTVRTNGIGVASVASDATLMNARTFDNAGGGAFTDRLVSAIRWCGREGAHVINMSLGFTGGLRFVPGNQEIFDLLTDAINDVRLGTDPANSGPGGVVVIASAGNDNLRYPSVYAAAVPADLPGVISVGSTLRNSNTRSSFSNRGTMVDIWAPGSSILGVCSTFTTNCLGGTIRQLPSTPGNPGRYMEISGTSMASPHVAGVAAIIYGRLGTTRSPAQGAAVEACVRSFARVAGVVRILPDPAGARTDALLGATDPGCGGAAS
ncbi:MAG: S8 family serine peptidase [Gemmatimonadaceae bacterium]|jgi:subtilisin family serine protease|nr:S8 family serine peptidase [Gemmatimonadaceae bacterium]